MEKHWTEESSRKFSYRITADFFDEIQEKLEELGLSQMDLAVRMGVSESQVSEIFDNPLNLTIDIRNVCVLLAPFPLSDSAFRSIFPQPIQSAHLGGGPTLNRRAVPKPEVLVLLSGGLDSTACLSFYVSLGRPCTALFIDYGQPGATPEEAAAVRVAAHFGVPLQVIRIRGARPKSDGFIDGRNAFLISAAIQERPPSVSVVALGLHKGPPYPDCTEEFVKATQKAIDVGTSARVQLAVPFLDWSKALIGSLCDESGVPVELTYSCEAGGHPPCGQCASCKDREEIVARASR